MGFKMPNGATFEISSEFGPVIPISAVSNSNPAIVTAMQDLEDGAIVAIRSGWTRLNDRAARVVAATDGEFSLENISTANKQAYPAGSGVGSLQEVRAFVEISQITDLASSGGDQQFLTFGFLADDDDRQMPTTKNPITMAITVADDPDLPYVSECTEADENKEIRVLRLNLPGGDSILYTGYVSITATPSLSRNNLMTRVISVALAARPVRYRTTSEPTT